MRVFCGLLLSQYGPLLRMHREAMEKFESTGWSALKVSNGSRERFRPRLPLSLPNVGRSSVSWSLRSLRGVTRSMRYGVFCKGRIWDRFWRVRAISGLRRKRLSKISRAHDYLEVASLCRLVSSRL